MKKLILFINCNLFKHMKILRVFLLFLTTIFSLSFNAQNPISWNVNSKLVENNIYELEITAHLEKGWHLYSQFLEQNEGYDPLNSPFSTYITYDLSPNFDTIGNTKEIGVETHYDPVWESEISFFSDKATFTQLIKLNNLDSTVFNGNINFMICNETQCLPPEDYKFKIELIFNKEIIDEIEYKTDSNTLAIIPKLEALDLNSPINNTCGDSEDENKSFWSLLILGFLGGLISLFTPCVFPMVPLTVSFFTKGGTDKSSGIGKALLYGFSIILVYVSLSLPFYIQGTDPEVLNNISSSAVLNIIFFIIFLVFAFSFFGYYELTLPTSWANKADKAADIGGFLGVMFMALVLAIVSFSCTGPLLGSVLAGSLDKGPVPITMAMLGFGIGLGLPFTLFAAFPSMLKSLPQSGGWLNSVKVVLGFAELALAFKFLSTADLVEHWGFLKYEAFLVIWILCAIGTALYLFGKIKFPHDSPINKLKPSRIVLGTLFVITAILYVINIEYFYNGLKTAIFFPIIIGFGIYSVFSSRNHLKKIISFKEAFAAYFICVAVGYLITTIGDIVIFKFIDPKAANLINEESMILTKQGLEIMQVKANDIDIALENMQNNPVYSYSNIISNYFIILLINAVFGMIPALIFKKS